jgi:hypothetical protein
MVLHHHWSLVTTLLEILGGIVNGGAVHDLALVDLTIALVLTLPISWHIEMAVVHHKLLLIVHVH